MRPCVCPAAKGPHIKRLPPIVYPASAQGDCCTVLSLWAAATCADNNAILQQPACSAHITSGVVAVTSENRFDAAQYNNSRQPNNCPVNTAQHLILINFGASPEIIHALAYDGRLVMAINSKPVLPRFCWAIAHAADDLVNDANGPKTPNQIPMIRSRR